MFGRAPEVRKTPLGQSLAEVGGRQITRHLWKELEGLGDSAARSARADRLIAGWSGDGYTSVWALTTSELVDGPVRLAGTPITITGQYLGGFRDVAAGPVAVVFDDGGVHLARAATPWWQTHALAWSDVRELRVEGHEETRQRVTAARVLIAGPLALAIPVDEDFSHAYVTVAAMDDDLVVRIDHARPLELKVRLGDVLRRPAGRTADAPPGAGGDLADQVARLGELHRGGVLTDEESAAAKRKLLGL